MTHELDRRRLLSLAGSLAGLSCLGLPATLAQAAPGLAFGSPEAFDFAWLKAQARERAAQDHEVPNVRGEEVLQRIDYDAYQTIRYRPEMALWRQGPSSFPVRFFHLGRYVLRPVRIHLVEAGQAREILYSPDLFDFDGENFGSELPPDIGFAGFRVMEPDGRESDWLAFQGASYFRSAGALDQYGLSARGIAIDTALPRGEEFPRFTRFWLESPPDASSQVVIYALLEGRSLTGAYRFTARKGNGVTMDVEAELHPRRAIERLGVAPLTSMFWYAESNRDQATDWRPEIHDSDGLAIWTGAGERIWRPLNNPPTVQTSSFFDTAPRGFGLLQRDREFDNYQDDGVFYDRRPSVWIEPQGDWGEGAVQLVEIPTDDEIHDNIVAYWLPSAPVEAGKALPIAYRLHWVDEEPFPDRGLARVVATRLGQGGVPGQPRPEGVRKFVIDFEGSVLEALDRAAEVEPVVTASRGTIDNDYALQIVGTTHWRAFFDLDVDGDAAVDLRCFLRLDGTPLSETWLYQYIPRED